jgi:predicted DNA-binding transcriptional regulator AlpA
VTDLITTWNEIETVTGLTRDDIRHKMLAEDFPLPRAVRDGPKARNGWWRAQVTAWLSSRGIRAKTPLSTSAAQGSPGLPDPASEAQEPR